MTQIIYEPRDGDIAKEILRKLWYEPIIPGGENVTINKPWDKPDEVTMRVATVIKLTQEELAFLRRLLNV